MGCVQRRTLDTFIVLENTYTFRGSRLGIVRVKSLLSEIILSSLPVRLRNPCHCGCVSLLHYVGIQANCYVRSLGYLIS